jgi:hypothetical protein
VDAAQDPRAGAAVVVLDEFHVDAEPGHLVGPEGLDEEPPFVAVDGRLDQHDSVDLGGEPAEGHFSALPYWRS